MWRSKPPRVEPVPTDPMGQFFYTIKTLDLVEDRNKITPWPWNWPTLWRRGKEIKARNDAFATFELERAKYIWLDSYRQTLVNVHPETDDCRENGCCIHNPSDHPLKNQPQVWRQKVEGVPGHMVRVCSHGIDHPDPDALAWQRRTGKTYLADRIARHNCDGCCGGPITDGVCPQCNDTGHYQYDENHSTICDLCCPHDQGSWQLTELYGAERAGKWSCKAGCGHTRNEGWGNE